MLVKLKDYIHEHGTVSLTDVSNRFRTPPDALRGMLNHWVQKGVIRREVARTPCNSCNTGRDCGACGVTTNLEIYQWVERS